MISRAQTNFHFASDVHQWLEEEAKRDGVHTVNELIHNWVMEKYNLAHNITERQTIPTPTPPEVREQGEHSN